MFVLTYSAALWNAACLLYLLSDGRQLEWGTMNGFVAALVVLIALPLLIGLSAGSSAISGGYEVRRWMRVATRVAAGCKWASRRWMERGS